MHFERPRKARTPAAEFSANERIDETDHVSHRDTIDLPRLEGYLAAAGFTIGRHVKHDRRAGSDLSGQAKDRAMTVRFQADRT